MPTDATTTQERTTLVGHVSLFPTVHHAITAVIAEMPAIGKEGRGPSDQGGYAYRGIEQITREVQPLLAKHGLVFVPKARLESWGPAPGMRDNWTDVVLSVEWTIVGPDGSTLTAQTIGIGRDSGDKGANKAMTQAFKYLLLDLFCVADAKDDSDGADYSAGHRGEPTRTTRSRPASPPRPSRAAARPPAPAEAPTAAAEEPVYRSQQEAAIHGTLRALTAEQRAAARTAFQTHFGSSLADLDPARHQDAAEWLSDWLASEAAVEAAGVGPLDGNS